MRREAENLINAITVYELNTLDYKRLTLANDMAEQELDYATVEKLNKLCKFIKKLDKISKDVYEDMVHDFKEI